ncbi:MAG: tyrosine-protein phosphatase [Solirubrobacteraceae bacterium]
MHGHVLPGIDDGPATLDEALALARAAREAGIETIVATPHVSARFPNDTATIEALVGQLNDALLKGGDSASAPSVLCGAEIAAAYLPAIDPSRLERLGIGGGRWLLIEPPSSAVAPGLEAGVANLLDGGFGVLIAHPERCLAFHRDPALLVRLVDAGALSSVTAAALVGRFGSTVKRFAIELVRAGLVHNVASDAHDLRRRPPSIERELAQAGLGHLGEWLTSAVPAAIVNDMAIPPRPVTSISLTARGSRLLRNLRGRP